MESAPPEEVTDFEHESVLESQSAGAVESPPLTFEGQLRSRTPSNPLGIKRQDLRSPPIFVKYLDAARLVLALEHFAQSGGQASRAGAFRKPRRPVGNEPDEQVHETSTPMPVGRRQ